MKPKVVSEEKTEAPSMKEVRESEALKPEAEPVKPARPIFKPKMKPPVSSEEKSVEEPAAVAGQESISEPKAEANSEPEVKPKPAFRPTMKPKSKE